LSQYVNFTEAELVAAAGDDPWKLNKEIQAGDAGAINDLADAFHQSGQHIKEADEEFDAAKRQFKEAYRKDDSEYPIDESHEVQRAATQLTGHPEELSRIAVDLEQVAAALAIAQRDSDAEIAALETQLHGIDDQITAALAANAPSEAAQLLESAKGATSAAAAQLEGFRGAYVAQLDGAEAAMMASGYAPDVIDDVDGVAGNAPREIAQRYDQSGQRARDQALVDKAHAEGRNSYLPSMTGQPGYMTREEADAAARLRDYQAITDPAHGYAHTAHAHGDDRPTRLAGQRLDDYLTATSTGPVPKDVVLGGDARTRAQARLNLQHDLQNGNVSWHQQPMTPDEATQLIDQMEVTDRTNALTRLQQQLQESGMTPQGAAGVAEGMSHGVVPKELVEGASAAGKPIAGGAEAFDRFGEALPTGKHWQPGVAFSPEDAEALKKIGGKLGWVGNAIDLGVGLYEWQHGAPLGEVVTKSAGGMAGAWALGAIGAEGGAAIAGPPGAFVGALVLGTVGAMGGEEAGEAAYKWLTG
jgi:hypothetical protein